MNKQEVIQQLRVQGNVIKLPERKIDLNTQSDIAREMSQVGGKWLGGKVRGFQFQDDPTPILQQIKAGVINFDRTQYNYCILPPEIAYKMVQLADVFPDDRILEPNATSAVLIEAVQKIHKEKEVEYCGLIDPGKLGNNLIRVAENFLDYTPGPIYDVILANPPITRNQDIDHIQHMFKLLRPGGRIVSIANCHFQNSSIKPNQSRFHDWLISNRAEIEELPPGLFRKIGNHSRSCIISLTKKVI